MHARAKNHKIYMQLLKSIDEMRVPVLFLRGPAQLFRHGVPFQAVSLLAEQCLHVGGARHAATAAACFLTGQACALAS